VRGRLRWSWLLDPCRGLTLGFAAGRCLLQFCRRRYASLPITFPGFLARGRCRGRRPLGNRLDGRIRFLPSRFALRLRRRSIARLRCRLTGNDFRWLLPRRHRSDNRRRRAIPVYFRPTGGWLLHRRHRFDNRRTRAIPVYFRLPGGWLLHRRHRFVNRRRRASSDFLRLTGGRRLFDLWRKW